MIDWPELPDCGVYLQWPEEGTDWIHPEDVELVRSWIPSNRIFFRYGFDGTYYQLSYGERTVRVKPTLWLKLEDDGLRIGDSVEVLSVNLEREPMVATILTKRYEVETQKIGYTLLHRELPLDRTYYADELRLLTLRHELRDAPTVFVRPVPEDMEAELSENGSHQGDKHGDQQGADNEANTELKLMPPVDIQPGDIVRERGDEDSGSLG